MILQKLYIGQMQLDNVEIDRKEESPILFL